MGICLGLLKFNILFGMCIIPDIFWVTSRCWVRGNESRKIESKPPRGVKFSELF